MSMSLDRDATFAEGGLTFFQPLIGGATAADEFVPLFSPFRLARYSSFFFEFSGLDQHSFSGCGPKHSSSVHHFLDRPRFTLG